MCQVQQFLKIIMIFNNSHFESLPYLLHLCALNCKTAVREMCKIFLSETTGLRALVFGM